jgi:iron(III) transport system permease protein
MRLRLSFALSSLLLLFLWLPFLSLIGGALWQAIGQNARLLLESLPLQPLGRSLFVNSLFLAALTGVLCGLLGVIPALALARGPKLLRPFVALFCALPLALPPTLMATAWLELSRTPPARSLASLAGDKPLPVDAVFVAAPVLSLCFFPLVAFSLGAAWRVLPADAEDAALLFGSPREAFLRFYTPLLAPALCGACGVCGALALWEMGACDLLDARTFAVEIYRAHSAGGEEVVAALRSLPLLCLGALFLWPALRALRFYERWESAREATPSAWATFIGTFSLLLLAVAVVGPIGVFVAQIGGDWNVFWSVWRDNAPEIFNTALVASLAAPLLSITALTTIIAWRDWPQQQQKTALWLGVLPLLFPPITLGIALVSFYNRPAFSLVYGGLAPTGWAPLDWLSENTARYAMLLIGYAARFGPLALWIFYESARRVDDTLLEAAQNLGATPQRARGTILMPLLRRVLLGTMACLWALCAGELTISVLVNQPGGQTLPVPIFNLMHIGETDRVAALSLTLVIMSFCSTVVVAAFLHFRKKNNL